MFKLEESMEEKLKKYKEILNLQNWDIQVIEEDSLEIEGMSKILFNDYKAIIKIKRESSDVEKDKTLIHELLHLIHRDESDLISDNLRDEAIASMYGRFHERSIEQMAKIIYKLCNS